MSTIQQELVIKARADVANAKQGLASLDQSVTGLASAQEGLQTASNDAAQGLAAEAAAATSAAQATAAAATASNDAAAAAKKLGDNAKGATSGIDEATNESKKLTKQLKDVGDEIDVAAGKMINGIGGPGAIKAIGFAGIALAGVQQVADQFMKSSEALFKTWGAEGEQAFSLATKKSNDMAGAFAGAILGTDDMYLAAGRLATIFEALNVAAQLAAEGVKKLITYSPGGQLLKFLFDVTGATEGYSEMIDSNVARIKNQIAKDKESATAKMELVEPIKTVKSEYEELTKTVDKLTGRTVVNAETERLNTIQKLKDLQTLAKAQELAAQKQTLADNVALKRAEANQSVSFAMFKKATLEIQNQYPSLTVQEREPMIAARQAELNITERPKLVEAQVRAYRESAESLMAEMGGVYEVGTQLQLDALERDIQELEKQGKIAAASAGGNIGRNFVGGIKKGIEESSISEDFKNWWKTNLGQVLNPNAGLNLEQILDLGGTADKYSTPLGPVKYMSEAEKEAAKQKAAAESEAELQKVEVGLGMRPDPAKEESDRVARETKKQTDAKALADNQKAAADAAKAESDAQIKNIQETSGAVLDLAGAFATLGGVQDGVIGKMRQVVDVVMKIMQATEALSATQVAQGAAATASSVATVSANTAAAASQAASSVASSASNAATAASAVSSGAQIAGAGAQAGSSFGPVVGAIVAVIGLASMLFSKTDPARRPSNNGKTIYTSAGEAQGEGGDFAYFEGGRQNVTIVTNDAASIRTMQGRLAFVGSRGGSGF